MVSIDLWERELLKKTETGNSIAQTTGRISGAEPSAVLAFFMQLQEMGLGLFYETAVYVDKVRIGHPKEIRDLMPIPPFVSHITIELTTSCNLDCIYCNQESRVVICRGCKRWPCDAGRLNLEDWKGVLSQARKLGCRRIEFVGGEPLLMWEMLRELLEFAVAIGYGEIYLNTNMLLATDEMIDVLVEHDVRFAIRVYSHNKRLHDKITQTAGSFSALEDNVRNLQRRKATYLVSLLVMRHNQEEMEEAKKYWTSITKRPVRVDYVYPHSEGKSFAPKQINSEYYDRTGRLPQLTKEHYFRYREGHPCWKGRLAVTSTGDILPCILARSEKLGNTRNVELWQVLKHGKHEKYWNMTKDHIEKCNVCEYRYACADCRVIESEATGQFNGMRYCDYNPYSGERDSQASS